MGGKVDMLLVIEVKYNQDSVFWVKAAVGSDTYTWNVGRVCVDL